MTKNSAAARRVLDARFERLRPLVLEARPRRGWVRAIRDALGMSSSELAARMGIAQSTVIDLEQTETAGTIGLATLARAADALGCEVVYFLVPRTSLEEAVRVQALAKAARHLGAVAHHSKLEDQEVSAEVANDQLERFAHDLIDRRGLWSPDSGA
jgi:predicted DNA-binding mobile mystery protein A